jgi:CubicO group peptidase (beta-lactamase class C family)
VPPRGLLAVARSTLTGTAVQPAGASRRYRAGMGTDDAGPAWSGTALVVRGSDVVEGRSAGMTGDPDGQLCGARSRFQACSISKLVLSTVVLSLVESGALDLQLPITTWLDDLPTSWSTITLHHLLGNTSGLGHWGDIPGLPRLLTAPPPLEELLALITAAPLAEPPGSGWRYSGPGFLTAGRVVQAVTGRPYAVAAAALVFTPADMADTSSGPAPAGPDVAVGHDHGRPWPLHPNFADIIGSGDLWTTTEDLVRLGQALRTEQLLTTRSAARLWTCRTRLAGPVTGPAPVVVTGYGYGTFLGRVRGHRARLNPGDMPGYQTLLAYLPDQHLDVAVLCNEEAPSLDAALADLSLP